MKNAQIENNQLYREFVSEMYRYGMGFGIDKNLLLDAIHDVFLHIFERNITLDDDSNMKFYLFRSLKNRLISLNRKEVPFESIDEEVDYEFSIKVSGFDIIEEEEVRQELIQRTETMLQTLTGRQREAIFLYYKEGLSYEEIGDLLNMTTKAARKLIYRALDRLRTLFSASELILLFFL